MKAKIKKIVISLLKSIIPVKKIIIFESNPDFSDNTYWLFKYIAETHTFSDYQFVWFIADYKKKCKELCGVPIVCVDLIGKSLFKKIRLIYYRCSAKIIIDCNRCIHKVRDEQIRVYLGHGMGIKKVIHYTKSIGECDVLITMGEGFRNRYEPYVKGAKEAFGYPRNEVLTKLSARMTERFIVWMPTFRQHNISNNNSIENVFPFGIPVIKSYEELNALQVCLKEKKMKLYIRLHPAQDTTVFKIENMDNICLADDRFLICNGINLYEFLAMSSALITDYSSVYYDYLLTERPIGLTLEDADVYASQWGLWYDNIREELPGYLIDTCFDMLRFIDSISKNEDIFLCKRREFCKRYDIVSHESSSLIIEYLHQLIKAL